MCHIEYVGRILEGVLETNKKINYIVWLKITRGTKALFSYSPKNFASIPSNL